MHGEETHPYHFTASRAPSQEGNFKKQKKRQALNLSLYILILESCLLALNQYSHWFLKQTFQRLQEGCAGGAVYYAVVAGEG